MALGSVRPFSEPLEMAAVELADLARQADRLGALVSSLVKEADAHLMIEAQAADLLVQRLVGLAAFLSALSDAAPPNAEVDVMDAVMGLTLAEQVRRLTGAWTHLAPPASGDVSLFAD